MQKKRVFISYSWDSKEHQEWVLYLANQLRKNGFEAETDIFEIQQKTVNLYKMMVEKVRDSDYIVVVLTENYAGKADSFEGGVGFESQLTLPLLMENPNKLVPIMRHRGDFNKVFPFHFKGQYAIDFSKDSEFDDKLEELIYKLYQKPRYFVEPVGEAPTLQPKIPSRISQTSAMDRKETNVWDLSDIEIPNLKRLTDRDIDKFMKESYQQIIELLHSLLNKVQESNPNFEFEQEDIHNLKTVFNLYIDGNSVDGVKIWYGGSFGRNSINLLYGRHMNIMSDNSMNEMISYEVNDKNQIRLKMTMNMFGNKDASTPEEIVKEIWKNHLSRSFL